MKEEEIRKLGIVRNSRERGEREGELVKTTVELKDMRHGVGVGVWNKKMGGERGHW